MLIVDLTKVAFYTRLVTDDRNLWLFGLLREGRQPGGTRNSVDWSKIYWYSAERVIGNFAIQSEARISFLFDHNGKITLTNKSRSQVWLNGELLELSQSIARKLEIPSLKMISVQGKMLEFESQLKKCYIRGINTRMLPQNSNTKDRTSAPSLTNEAQPAIFG